MRSSFIWSGFRCGGIEIKKLIEQKNYQELSVYMVVRQKKEVQEKYIWFVPDCLMMSM
jgi:hypothetical protein